MRVNYVSPELLEDQVESDPVLQVLKWAETYIAPNSSCYATLSLLLNFYGF